MDSPTPSEPCPLHHVAGISAHGLCAESENSRRTFAEADKAAAGFAEYLNRQGCTSGDRITLCLPSGIDWIPLVFGALRAGVILCPLNTRLPSHTLETRCRDLNPKLRLDRPPQYSGSEAAYTVIPNQPATIIFTSGSSGKAKAVVHTLANHLASARSAISSDALTPGNRWLHTLPLYHVGGLAILFRCITAAATVVFPDPNDDITRALQHSKATHVSMVPTQLIRLLQTGASGDDFPALKRILIGGAPAGEALLRQAIDAGFPVAPSYGMTETASQVAAVSLSASRYERTQTSGKVLPHAAIRLSSQGEILIRGESLSPGFWKDGEILPLTDRDGWLHSRDCGELDAQGNLIVTGRMDRMFISGGENIHPERIEHALLDISGATAAVVVPVSDPEFGHRPAAWIDIPPTDALIENWNQALRKTLPGYMIPVTYKELPDGQGLKPDWKTLSEQ